MTQIDVASALGTYPVVIGAGAVSRLASLLKTHALDRDVIVVSCGPVWHAHGSRLKAVLGRHAPVIIADGERAKTLGTVSKIYDAMVQRRLDRSATLIAFGGGIVGDVAGFAAASYLRGIRLVQVPTTLLAQVDSAIGGKVGVNLPAGKNLVGAFHPPAMVVCDPTLLESLPAREFRAGLYEVVKYGVIASRPLWDRVSDRLDAILAHDARELAWMIAECCRIKARVVTMDERESGPRRVLNFGHTIGHALEAVTHYRRFRHGEAVAYGMLAASHISRERRVLSDADEQRLHDLIARMGPLPPVSDLRAADALDAVRHDKKVVNGRLQFVLASAIGSTMIAGDVQPKELKAAMRQIGMRA